MHQQTALHIGICETSLTMQRTRRYFPCTVQWFLERCELQLIRKGWRRRVLRVIDRVGEVNGGSLKRAQAWFGAQPFKRSFMMLRLVDPSHRVGQPDRLNQVSFYILVFQGWPGFRFKPGSSRLFLALSFITNRDQQHEISSLRLCKC